MGDMTVEMQPLVNPSSSTEPKPADRVSAHFPSATVRLIPLAEAGPRIAGQAADRLTPERSLELAHEQLRLARARVAQANEAQGRATDEAATAQDFAARARVAYERARSDARRADLVARRSQRLADQAKLELRQAYEVVAHLEGMSGVVNLDLDATDRSGSQPEIEPELS